MGLFSERKPYTAISAEAEALMRSGSDTDPARLLNLVELIQDSRPADAGAHEAGRLLRKALKHGGPNEQRRALNLTEMLVDNGIHGRALVVDSGLGDQLCQLATSHAGHLHGRADLSKSSKVARHAQSVLTDWSRRKDPSLNRLFKQAGLADRSQRSKRQSMHPDDDLDAAVFGDDSDHGAKPRARPRSRSTSSRRSWGSPTASPSGGTTASPRARSRSPSPINLRGAGLTATIAAAHNVSTRLTNALITNRRGSHETAQYYKQAKQLRRRVIQLVHDQSAEVQAYIGQLLQANEELVAALQAHDAVVDGAPLDAQDDHESMALPSQQPPKISHSRPPPSPSRSLPSSDNEDDAAGSDLIDLNDPFADHNEEVAQPKHTPFW